MSDQSLEKPPSQGYSCPYRKRNPSTFNKEDYTECSLVAFMTMDDLK